MEKILIMKRVLIKMINLNVWGGKHTELKNLKKCIPKHLRGEKAVDGAVKDLIQFEFIVIKKSTCELHVSLNPQKQQEIYEFVKRDEK